MTPSSINRREALSRLGLLLGGVMIGSDIYLGGATLEGKVNSAEFTTGELALLDEIGETIIPATNTPGAKAVGIGAFIARMVSECYDDSQQAAFKAGMRQLDVAAMAKYGTGFLACGSVQRTTLLNTLDREVHADSARPETSVHYFHLIKKLTLLGYFTSEIGATQALRYVEVPGSFDGNAPYKSGDRAWFEMPSRSL